MTQRRSVVKVLALVLGVVGLLGLGGYAFMGSSDRANATDPTQPTEQAVDENEQALASRAIGPSSGQPLPRFVSLKSDKVNVRRGPSSEHQVAWVYSRRNLPVEVTAEFEHWRRIRDSDGEEGWVYHSLLSSRRSVIVSPWKKGTVMMLSQPDRSSRPVAQVESGVLGFVDQCTGEWCRIETNGYSGWLRQDILWGVYPGEKLK
jgi:SH3-like domain-containing protein